MLFVRHVCRITATAWTSFKNLVWRHYLTLAVQSACFLAARRVSDVDELRASGCGGLWEDWFKLIWASLCWMEALEALEAAEAWHFSNTQVLMWSHVDLWGVMADALYRLCYNRKCSCLIHKIHQKIYTRQTFRHSMSIPQGTLNYFPVL